MESRVSVYGIAVGVWHHQRCIFLRLDSIRLLCNQFHTATSCGFHARLRRDWVRAGSNPSVKKVEYLFYRPFTKFDLSRIDSGRFSPNSLWCAASPWVRMIFPAILSVAKAVHDTAIKTGLTVRILQSHMTATIIYLSTIWFTAFALKLTMREQYIQESLGHRTAIA